MTTSRDTKNPDTFRCDICAEEMEFVNEAGRWTRVTVAASELAVFSFVLLGLIAPGVWLMVWFASEDGLLGALQDVLGSVPAFVAAPLTFCTMMVFLGCMVSAGAFLAIAASRVVLGVFIYPLFGDFYYCSALDMQPISPRPWGWWRKDEDCADERKDA